jgi:hypothetical protein
LNILVIYGSAAPHPGAWHTLRSERGISIRHLHAADLPQRIASADFVALDVSCGRSRVPWAQLETLLAERNVPTIVFEQLDARSLNSAYPSGTCVAELAQDGSVQLQCQVQQSAFARMAIGGAGPAAPDAPEHGDGERLTRFVFQGK